MKLYALMRPCGTARPADGPLVNPLVGWRLQACTAAPTRDPAGLLKIEEHFPPALRDANQKISSLRTQSLMST